MVATPNWKFFHIGIEGDDVSYKGQNLWKCSDRWQSQDQSIIAPHPSYPNQMHSLSVYKVEEVIFAVGEVSPGVWVFCVPA